MMTGALGLLMAGVTFALVSVLDGSDGDAPEDEDAAGDLHPHDPAGTGSDLAQGAGLLDDPDAGTQTSDGVDAPDKGASHGATAGADTLWGDLFDDDIDGAEGNDQIDGYGGDDVLSGGRGNDALAGEAGDDSLSGGEGRDTLAGDDGADLLDGGAGADTLTGAEGDDTLSGGAGDDSMIGGGGDDSLMAGLGADTLEGASGDDTLIAGDGPDALEGGSGNDLLHGAGGGWLNGGTGADTLEGGAGDVLSGGEDGDLFTLAARDAGADATTITDYDPAQDRLALVYDASATPHPQVTLEASDKDDLTWVMLNGAKVAAVHGARGLVAGDVLLVPRGRLSAG